jgi:hypothetical protein
VTFASHAKQTYRKLRFCTGLDLYIFYSAFETTIPDFATLDITETNVSCVTQYWILSTSEVPISSVKYLKTQFLPNTALCVSIGKTNSMSRRRLLGVPRYVVK